MSDQKLNLEQLSSFCKRRGFVYPSSEIYGGFGAIYDYGPLGTELKKNLAELWWRHIVQMRRDVVGIDSGIFMHPRTWEASGHTESFDDPQMECRTCHNRIRADHFLENWGLDVDRWPIAEVNAEIQKLRDQGEKVVCDKCGGSDLTEAKQFNLLVKSNLGSPTDDLSPENLVFLRGETCQGIYLNFKNVLDTMRVRVPFGIAQIGKAFRNEIVARQFVFRTREFEQMEMQYFIHKDDTEKYFQEWRDRRWQWHLETVGLAAERLRFKPHDKLAHYASAAEDIEYDFAALGGFKEMEGIHARGDWDLGRHTEFSNKKLDFLDTTTGEKFIPHVIETSIGLNRLFLAVIDNAYHEEQLEDGTSRIVLKFKPNIAPVKVAVMPLQKKPAALTERAQAIWAELAGEWNCEYDETGSIGKRYRRQDEIGTPFCVTVDFDTIGEGDAKLQDTVTVRDRDTLEQRRVPVVELRAFLAERLG